MTIYTANFGNYDNVYPGADVVYNEQNDPFPGNKHITGKMRAKMYKVLNPESHDIWIDSSVEILDRDGFEELFGSGQSPVFFKHPVNHTLESEIELCVQSGHVSNGIRDILLDRHGSLEHRTYVGGIFGHMTTAMREAWWVEICLVSDRDQITLPFILSDSSFTTLDVDIYNNPYFKIHSHK